MNRLIAQNTDGMVIVLCRLVNPAPLIELINGVREISLHQAGLLSLAPHHNLQRLPGLHHHQIIVLAGNQLLCLLQPLLDPLPAGGPFHI